MRSQLTRHALRRLCGPSFLPPRPIFRTYPVGCRVIRTPQRRTFLGFFQKPPRALRELETDPGYGTFLQFRANENDSVRPPRRSELVQAWREFFGYKAKYDRVVNSTQALCAHRVLSYLSQPNNGIVQTQPNYGSLQLSEADLRLARDCLSIAPEDDANDHLILAKGLYAEIRRRTLGLPHRTVLQYTSKELRIKPREPATQKKDFYQLLAIMSHYGEAREARDLLLDFYNEWVSATSTPLNSSKGLWMPVILGLAREGHEQDLLDVVALARKAGLEFDSALHGVMSVFYARRNNVEETKSWFSKQIYDDKAPSRTTYYEILQFAIRNNEQEWAKGVYQDLVEKLATSSWRLHKSCWDTSFCWAVVLLGKGADHVEHMLKVSLEKTQDIPASQPSIISINSLLRVAIDINDPYLAERLTNLAEKMGFEPNIQTYLLQMEYRLKASDLDGAYATFRTLPSEETKLVLPVLNEFIRALCAAPRPHYGRILEVTSYLEERRATLEPQTVVSICMAFLRNDEHYEVIDTLSLHTAHYSIKERETVRQAFVAYCLDRQNSTARAWDAYALLRQFFPELETAHREAIMDAFLDRRRADMACHVFGHMRAHGSPLHRPTLATYARFFEGLGRAPDVDSLRTVHNMLKMDATIGSGAPDTRALNGLMIAYAACGRPDRALDLFWADVSASAEGPTYESLEIAFRSCELSPFGAEASAALWDKIVRMEIDVPLHVYSAYVGARAAHAHGDGGGLEEVKRVLVEMEDVVGKRPNLHTLAIVYNALQSNDLKDEFEAWAKEEYAPVWEKLAEKYRRRDAEGILHFKIARPWKA